MIVYVATYPRSGSGLLRQLIRACFDIAISNGHEVSNRRAIPSDDPDLMASKFRPSGKPPRLMVREPAVETLTEATRERLAALSTPLFVKTHLLPPRRAFPGELAVQMVRHPGAALYSLSVLTGQSLDEQVEPSSLAGDWSTYHAAWRGAPMPVARIRYEDNFGNPAGALDEVIRLTGLSPLSREFERPEEATARAPSRNPGFGPDHWRTALSAQVVGAIWRRHGVEASLHGYDAFGARPQTA